MTLPVKTFCSAFLLAGLLVGCGNILENPELSVCAQAGAQDNADNTGLISLSAWTVDNLTESADSAVLQRFLDQNKITDSMRHLVKVGKNSGKLEIADLTVTLDSTQGQDTLVLVSGMESIALRYLRIHGGRFKYVTGESHLPRKLIVLNLSGSWKQIWTGPFSLPQLEFYAINPGQITDLGSALQQAQQSPCLAELNLSSNRLTTVPAGMTSWNFVTRALSLSGNSICTVSHDDSTWITAAEKSSSFNHFWPQTCPGP